MDEWKLDPAHDLDLQGMERYRSPRREGGLMASGARLLWWGMLRGIFRIWNRLDILGCEHLPAEPPFVLVANHASHLDALLLTAVLPMRHRDRTFSIAAQDVFFERFPLAAFAATFINAIPVQRRAAGVHALSSLRERLVSEPGIFILFPEGRRSRDGTMDRFKPGIGMLVAGTSIPVVPCHIQGAFEAMPPNSWLLRSKRITLRVGPPQVFADLPGDRTGWDRCAESLDRAVRTLDPQASPLQAASP